jgi:FkbM family methyltransferase
MNAFKIATIKALGRILPDQIKNSLFHLSFHLAPGEFEKFAHDYGFAPHMKLGLAAMAKRGFEPKSIIDVGAFEGNWSKIARQIWPDGRLYMIEPNLKKRAQLDRIAKELDACLFGDLLGAHEGQEVQFNLMESGSSVMAERSPLPRAVETRRLSTLDSLLGHVDQPGLLKIDAQGYELEILKGASAILPCLEAVLLEVATIEINEGAPLLHDVVAYMKNVGFVTYDILEIHRRPLDRALNQVDIVFVRETSSLIADKRHFA